MSIGIVDYGMGNLRSVQKALEHLHFPAAVLTAPSELAGCDGVILPGVGAFRDAIAQLDQQGFSAALRDYAASGKPLLGICLGMQLFFEHSTEDGDYQGLGLLAGDVLRFRPEPELKIPHMGWNALDVKIDHPFLTSVTSGDFVYFVHSYHVAPTDPAIIACETTHGTQAFASVVIQDNVWATQFHPEKSQRVGLQLLRNFGEAVTGTVPVLS